MSINTFDGIVEDALLAGWRRLEAAGRISDVVAYGLIAAECGESIDPLVLTGSDARAILADWHADDRDPRCALAAPIARHSGDLLDDLFAPVREAAARFSSTRGPDVEQAVIRALRRLDRKRVFGDRIGRGGPWIGFLCYEMSVVECATSLAELNPAAWIEQWITPYGAAVDDGLELHGQRRTEVAVRDCSASRDGNWLITSGWDGRFEIWDAARPIALLTAHSDHRHGTTAHALSADRRSLFLAWRTAFPETYGLFRYDTISHARLRWGGTHDHAAWALATHPTADLLAVGEDTGAIAIWDVARETIVRELSEHRSPVRALAYACDGATLYSCTREDGVRAWDAGSGTSLFHTHLDAEFLLLSPCGQILVVLSCGDVVSQRITLLHAVTGAVVRTIHLNPGHDGEEYSHLQHGARCAAFSADGTRLAVGVGFGEDNAHVRLLEFPTGARLGGVRAGHEEVTGVCFSPGTRDRILFTGRHCRGAQLYEWHVRAADGRGPAN